MMLLETANQAIHGNYLSLRRTQTTLEKEEPDWESWLVFFLQAMQKQKILEIAREQGSLKSSDVEKLTGESRSTIISRLKDLVDEGHLVRHGKGPSTWYTLKRVSL